MGDAPCPPLLWPRKTVNASLVPAPAATLAPRIRPRLSTRYDVARDAIELEFRSGGVITIPRQVVPGLAVGPRSVPRTASNDALASFRRSRT